MTKLILGIFTLMVIISSPLYADITGKLVHYKAGNTKLVGYIAYDNSLTGKRPGVIIVPDWWGHGKFVRDRARALAKQGYTAMVMDNYGNGLYVEPPSEASALMNKFTANPKTMETRFDATYKTLISHKTVDSKQVAAIGYSLGGLVVLEMARLGKNLNGVASIWGVIGKPARPAGKGQVKASILVLAPAKDGWAPVKEVNNLKKEMKAAGASIKVITYPGTKHGFSRPDADARAKKYNTLPIRYNAKATKQSRNDLNAFLKTSFE